jgi:hypothetical protein
MKRSGATATGAATAERLAPCGDSLEPDGDTCTEPREPLPSAEEVLLSLVPDPGREAAALAAAGVGDALRAEWPPARLVDQTAPGALLAALAGEVDLATCSDDMVVGLAAAAARLDLKRLPELFCGFPRRGGQGPTAYPVACSPQAWAAGTPFLLLQAMLGISAAANDNLLSVNKPHLPPWLNEVELHNLRVGESTLSLVFRREGETTGFTLLSREGDVRVVMED